MHPPFSAAQFFDVFRRYNEAVWPAQIALNLFGLAVAAAAWRARRHQSFAWARAAFAMLAALWLWTGVAYFLTFFTAITAGGKIFGALFVAEGFLLLMVAWRGVQLETGSAASVIAGVSILAYALLGYPAVALLAGQTYPALPTFGAPCPVTIFTFGFLSLLPASRKGLLLVIPLLWVAVSAHAVIAFHVVEDIGLPVAAIVAITVLHQRPHRSPAGHIAA